ncbi:MAG: ribonuclease D, partial [Candidatus Thioglobus sp.]|nr:ribonuclease D [Candidatus Thioglobus sp.]
MIQTPTQLRDFLHSIKDETELAIDTEFKRVNTYYPVLCLVQIATKKNTDCIDVLALDDLNPLFDKLYQDDCLWIVHSARQDIEALHYLSKQLPKQLFDTQIAASLVNYPAQISYQALTESLQNVHLEKAYTRLDWTIRPLPDEAIEYALDDVRYLLKNY